MPIAASGFVGGQAAGSDGRAGRTLARIRVLHQWAGRRPRPGTRAIRCSTAAVPRHSGFGSSMPRSDEVSRAADACAVGPPWSMMWPFAQTVVAQRPVRDAEGSGVATTCRGNLVPTGCRLRCGPHEESGVGPIFRQTAVAGRLYGQAIGTVTIVSGVLLPRAKCRKFSGNRMVPVAWPNLSGHR